MTDRLQCPLCERHALMSNMNKHHVIPKSCGGFDTAMICKTCHSHLHAVFGNKELEEHLSTIEDIKKHPMMQLYFKWASKVNPDRKFKSRRSKEKKR